MNIEDFPETCCKVTSQEPFKLCNKEATHWYLHNRDICSYCEEHDYQCGVKIIKDLNEKT